MNIVIQSKTHLESSRRIVKEKQGREAYNLLNTIENQIFDNQLKDIDKSSNLMQTKSHGIINRFSK